MAIHFCCVKLPTPKAVADPISLHTTAPTRHRRLSSKSAPVKTAPCKWFNSTAGCEAGDACTFQHVQVIPLEHQPAVPRPWRTKPCRHYQVGRCRMGDSCHYAHVDAAAPPSSPSGSPRTRSHDSQAPSPSIARHNTGASMRSSKSPGSPQQQPFQWNGTKGDSPVHPSAFSASFDSALLFSTTEKKDYDATTSTHSDPVPSGSHTLGLITQRRASAPPMLPETSTITIPPPSGALHSSSDTPARKEACADWLATGRCQREGCPFAHSPTTPLTEEHLSKACAELRLLKRYDDSDSESEGEEDDVEFVTVANSSSPTGRSMQSPTSLSLRSISTNSI